MSKQVKYRGRWFPLKREDGEYVIIESYGLERRVLKDEIIYEEPVEPKDILKPVIPDKLEETLPPANDIVEPKPEGDEFHGKTVKNIRDGRIGKVASIGTLRHTPNSQSVTVYWDSDPKNPQEVDKRLLEIVAEEPKVEKTITTEPAKEETLAPVVAPKPEETTVVAPKLTETPLVMPEPKLNISILPKEETLVDPTCSPLEKFKEEMKAIWENSFSSGPALKAGTYTTDIQYPDSENPGETLTYRVVFDLYGEGLSEMNFVSVDDLDSPQEDTSDYDPAILENMVDEKIATGDVFPLPTEDPTEAEVPQGDSNALDADNLDETKTAVIAPVQEEATVAPVAGGTNQGQPNDGAFNARLGQKVVQPKPV